MAKDPRDALREAVQYQDLGKGLGPRLAKCLIRSTDDLLDRMGELVDRHADELGGSPRETALWLSSVWGPFDEAWLMQCAASLPEPARGRWVAMLASPRFDRSISRRKAIAYASRMAAERLERDALEVAGPPLGKVAEEASARTAFQVARSAGVGFSFSMPNEGQIERVLNSAGISKSIKGFSQASVRLVEDEVVRGMMAGSSFEDIARTIRKETPVESMVRARRIARTMSTDCAAEAKMREYEELGVERYTIVCTLDERTCATCGAMDGRSFPVKGAHPRPSFHPNCRCVVREELSKEWTERMTRSARDEDGRTVQVPASMTYDEWRKRFAKPAPPGKAVQPKPRSHPGPRAGASASPGTQGRQAENVETKKPEEKRLEAKSLGNIGAVLKEEEMDLVQKRLDDAPEDLRRAWESHAGDIKVTDKKVSSCFNPRTGSVEMDLSRNLTSVGNGASAPAHDILWHEVGHNLDYSMQPGSTAFSFKSAHYRSTAHALKDGSPATLGDMVKEEAKEHIDRYKKEKFAEKGYRTAREYTAAEVRRDFGKDLRALGIAGRDVSDMFSGATDDKMSGGWHHSASYWKAGMGAFQSMEAFAEMTSATMCDPDSLELIKRYFPKSYEIYLEILRDDKGV